MGRLILDSWFITHMNKNYDNRREAGTSTTTSRHSEQVITLTSLYFQKMTVGR